ncbi:hypothetical protein [Paraclostridium bifermentans]|uniref:hypothetical protein n=1 Tax=Paraclostridium bifermentans TaxID=1490 RepID=UPI00387B0F86
MLKFLQRIGKSLMLPIAALPIAGIMLRLGQPDIVDALGGIPFLQTIYHSLGQQDLPYLIIYHYYLH